MRKPILQVWDAIILNHSGTYGMAPVKMKRGKSNIDQQPRKKQKRRANEDSASAGRNVPIDALPWNEVALPDHLEDAEGFFGLEEVSDVEVVTDRMSARPQFLVRLLLQKAIRNPFAN